MDKVRIVVFDTEPTEEAYLRKRLKAYDVTFCKGHVDETTVHLAENADVISVFIHSFVPAALMAKMPKLRLITTRSTGYDHIDLEQAKARNITVCHVPRYGENTVAEHTFALILALSRKVHKAYVRTLQGDFSLSGLRGFDLKGKTIGVIGAGSIGMHVIRIAKGFGMHVLAFDVHPNDLFAEVLGFEYTSLEDALRRSDIVTLHLPLNRHTHHLINKERLQMMKRGSLLINTARGGVVDTDDLLWALEEGILAGAGLDVVEGEEFITEERQLLHSTAAEEKLRAVVRTHVLQRRDDVVITPHIAFNSEEALQRILETTAQNIDRFLEGNPLNTVTQA